MEDPGQISHNVVGQTSHNCYFDNYIYIYKHMAIGYTEF